MAYTTERHQWTQRLVRSSFVYVLSLSVYATTWSYYGSVGFAQQQGLIFLTIYLGVTLAFVLAPVLLLPILRITRTHQLTSVADLFAFRFNSQPAGVLVTLMMLIGSLPYVALQIRAVSESTQVLEEELTHSERLGWVSAARRCRKSANAWGYPETGRGRPEPGGCYRCTQFCYPA